MSASPFTQRRSTDLSGSVDAHRMDASRCGPLSHRSIHSRPPCGRQSPPPTAGPNSSGSSAKEPGTTAEQSHNSRTAMPPSLAESPRQAIVVPAPAPPLVLDTPVGPCLRRPVTCHCRGWGGRRRGLIKPRALPNLCISYRWRAGGRQLFFLSIKRRRTRRPATDRRRLLHSQKGVMMMDGGGGRPPRRLRANSQCKAGGWRWAGLAAFDRDRFGRTRRRRGRAERAGSLSAKQRRRHDLRTTGTYVTTG